MSEKETIFCQSCGMPLTDDVYGTNADGSKNHEYCIYCYKDGSFTGDFTMEQMAEYCSMFVAEYNKHTGQKLTREEYKETLLKYYPSLTRWSQPADTMPHADHPLKKTFIKEVNALAIEGLQVDNLFVLQGSHINLPYTINGNTTKLLDDNATYWGTQVPKNDGRYYGIACCDNFILVSEYGNSGSDAEIVVLKKRQSTERTTK